ncbi:MAG: hypothetical protein Kow00108_07290 [Calditrichia bacterium]
MYRFNLNKIFFHLILLAGILSAQSRVFNRDVAQFSTGKSNETFVEVYCSVLQGKLQAELIQDSLYRVDFQFTVDVMEDDSVIDTRPLRYSQVIPANRLENIDNPFYSVHRFFLPPGPYTIHIRFTDHISGVQETNSFEVSVKSFSQDLVEMSDLQFSSHISKILPDMLEHYKNLIKNNLLILPRTTAILTNYDPLLWVYTEVYNLNHWHGDSIEYRLNLIFDSDSVKILKRKIISWEPSDRIIAEGFNVISLNPGTYRLMLSVHNLKTGAQVSEVKPFTYLKILEEKKYQKSEQEAIYAGYTNDMLNRELEFIDYLLTNDERKMVAELGNDATRQFLIEFWKKRDPDVSTSRNEFRDRYLQRIRKTNGMFTIKNTPGWKSDRGRIYILYGPPDEIERFESESNMRPHIVWHYYNLEGGVEFIFGDINFQGDYRLLHSTHPKELKNPQWRHVLQTIPDAFGY